jgi:hypothetical protein
MPSRRNTEGHVYNCSWKRSGDDYLIWLEKDQTLLAQSTDFEEAQDQLCELICERFGDGEAVLELNPPPPVTESVNWHKHGIVRLGYNAHAELLNRDERFFAEGRCPRCNTPRGARTDNPLHLKKLPPADTFVVSNFIPTIQLFSESFLSLLTQKEKAVLQFQPVKVEGSTRRRFFELVGNPSLIYVGIKNATFVPPISRRCPLCGFRSFLMKGPDIPMFSYMQDFVAEGDLPTPLPSVFLAGSVKNEVALCLPRQRWLEMRGKPGTKGIPTSRIGVVPASRVERNLDLPVPLDWQQ